MPSNTFAYTCVLHRGADSSCQTLVSCRTTRLWLNICLSSMESDGLIIHHLLTESRAVSVANGAVPYKIMSHPFRPVLEWVGVVSSKGGKISTHEASSYWLWNFFDVTVRELQISSYRTRCFVRVPSIIVRRTSCLPFIFYTRTISPNWMHQTSVSLQIA